ncbi:MAG: ATP-binding protein [Flavobacteriaceae bacterium]|nr:ATP-binding protein [Flavobacteriaceae bacterium]
MLKVLKKKTYVFGITSALFITLIAVALFAFIKIIDLPFTWLIALVTGFLIFLISFFIIQFRVEKFIYKHINRLRKNLSLLENVSFDRGKVTTDMHQLTEDIEKFAREKKLELEKLRITEAYRKEFMGNISHELKTPLFTVQGYIDTLIDGAHKDKSIRKKYLNRAAKGVERLVYIVNDLDMITKLEMGDLKLNYQNFNIIQTIQNVFEMFEMKAAKKNIQLRFDLPYNEPIMVRADEERVQQVLNNLIVNAIKYGKTDGQIEVSVEDLIKNKVIIRITDDGEGISEENIPRIFERFFRVDKSGSRKEGGSGLGLSIVKHILSAHNEKIYVESELGKGSEFSFTLEKASVKKAANSEAEKTVSSRPE